MRLTIEEIFWLLEAQDRKRRIFKKRDEDAWNRVKTRIDAEIEKWRRYNEDL